MSAVQVSRAAVKDLSVFYRSAGSPTNPTILLLHGFPSSSHQFRNLIRPLASAGYHVVAPDLPGFGFTTTPANFKHTFESLTDTIEGFLDVLHITTFAVYIFDYGAPTGLRLALRRPHAVTAIISQNGNAYLDGFGAAFWAPVQKYWATGTGADRALLRAVLSLDAVKGQYVDGESQPERIAPEAYTLDHYLLTRPGVDEVQLDLFYDYRTNVDLYPAFQKYFRESQVPLLAAWGANDTIFVKEGAEAFRRDLPGAEVVLLDAGHFAAETQTEVLAGFIERFLKRNGI